jgi:hypothetical protein
MQKAHPLDEGGPEKDARTSYTAAGGRGIGPIGMKAGGSGIGPIGIEAWAGGSGIGPIGIKAWTGGSGIGPIGIKAGGSGMGPIGIKSRAGGSGIGPIGIKVGGSGMGPIGIAFAVQAVTTSSPRKTTLRIFNVPGRMEISPGGGNPPYNFATTEYPQSGDRI